MRGSVVRGEILGLERQRFWSDEDKLRIVTSVGIGGQVTDANGLVSFETVFPGWYDPRVTHIHAKVSRNGETFLTTQLYFLDEMVADIYANHPDYKDYGACPYNLTNDSALRDLASETGVVLKTERTENLISASVRFGIA